MRRRHVRYAPTDATTNPSLIYKAAQIDEYQHLVDEAIAYGKSRADLSENERLSLVMDKLAVNFGKEITKIIPGLESLNFFGINWVVLVFTCTNLTPTPPPFHNGITTT